MTGKLAAAALMVGLAVGGASCKFVDKVRPSENFANRNPMVAGCEKVLPVREGTDFRVEVGDGNGREYIARGIVGKAKANGTELSFEFPNGGGMIAITLRIGEITTLTNSGGKSGSVTACPGANGEAKLAGDVAKYE